MAATGEEKIAATVLGYYLTSLGRAPTAASGLTSLPCPTAISS